jgi:hypothetical protein
LVRNHAEFKTNSKGWPLLSRNWSDDVEKINKTFYNLKTRKLPFWLASHIEGTRLVPEKIRQSQEYAKKNDLPVTNHVLLPRKKGNAHFHY